MYGTTIGVIKGDTNRTDAVNVPSQASRQKRHIKQPHGSFPKLLFPEWGKCI